MGKIKIQRSVADCLKKLPRDMKRKEIVKERQRSGRSSVMNAMRAFLTADTFMYGPLTAKSYPGPEIWNISGEERENRLNAISPISTIKEILHSPGETLIDYDPILQVIDPLDERTEASGQIVHHVSFRKTVTTTTVAQDEKGDVRSDWSGILHQDQATPNSVETRGDAELTEPEGDEELSWDDERQDEEDNFHAVLLDQAVAEKVANRLILGLGGRFSDDLGINVDISDSAVECWFLAANLLHRSVSFTVSKATYEELSKAGVSKIVDVLSLKESALAAILEKTGFTKYGRRVASTLTKLATYLETNNWGRISTFKHTSGNQELICQLRSLPGVKLHIARTFLRELHGLWKGVTPEFEMRTKKAAMHLKLLGSIKVFSNPEGVLSKFAQEAGIDLRDLHVALYKLGTKHERQYDKCPGGSDCHILLRSDRLLGTLPSEVLLQSM